MEKMVQSGSFITLTLDLSEPIEAKDFGRLFEGLALEFERSIATSHQDISEEAKIYVREIRQGSIIADLVPLIQNSIVVMHDAKVVADFATLLTSRLNPLLGGKSPKLKSKSEMEIVANLLRPVAADRDGNAQFESVVYEQGFFKKKLEVKFNSKQARRALEIVEQDMVLIDQTVGQQHKRVTMSFVRSSVVNTALGKRSGELIIIESLSKKALPVIYASDLAERQIKHEIKESEDNVFRKIFVVDVDVEIKGGREIAYRITNLHQVFDMPED